MNLDTLLTQSLTAVQQATTLTELDAVRVTYLGQKGTITALLKELGTLSPEEKRTRGAAVQQVRTALTEALETKKAALEAAALAAELASQQVDVTLPASLTLTGRIHPLTAAMEEIASALKTLGFVHAWGPEVETDDYNFTKLNLPPHHPARQDQDTFYLQPHAGDGGQKRVLRTQTSNVQIRVLEAYAPPFRVMGIGRVYRRDYDLTHTPQFHQVEGMACEPGLHMGHMKGVLEEFTKLFFGKQLTARWRPHYFPFTEPSAELDIGCLFCSGKGCRVCKHSGWLEVLGCGMTHRNVMANSPHIRTPEAFAQFPAFAFGAGVERLAMLKYGISDLRLMFESHGEFLHTFGQPPVAAV